MLQHHFNETLLNVALNSLTSSLCCLGLPKSSPPVLNEPLNCSELQSTPNLNVHSLLSPTVASATASLAGPNSEDRIITPKSQPVHRFDCSFSPDSHSQLPYYKYSCQPKLAPNLTENSECDSVAASATATAASFPATSDLVLASLAISEPSPMNPDCNSYPEPIHPYSNSFFSNSPPPNGLAVDVDHERLVEASGFGVYHTHHPRNRRHLYDTTPPYWERRLTSPQSTTLIPSDNNHCDNKKTKTSAKIVKRNRTGKRKRKLLTENRCSAKVNNNNGAVNSNFYSANPVSQLRNCSQLQNNNSSGDVLLKKSYYQTKKDCAIGVDENEGAPEEEPEEDEDEMETDDGPVNDEDHSTELNLIMMLNDQQSPDNELSHGVTNPLVGDKRILHEMDNTVAYDPHYYHNYPMPNYPPACVVAPVPPSSYPSTPRHYQQYFNGTGGGSNSPMTATTGASSIQPSSGTPPQSTLNLSPSSPVTTTTTHIQPNSGSNRSNSFDQSHSSSVNPQSHPHSHLPPHPQPHHLSHLHLYSDPANPHHPSSVNQSHCIKSDPSSVEPTKSHPLELSSSSSSPPPSLHFNDKVCFGCRQTLSTSPIIASVSGYHKWHTNCLCCSECSQSLSQSRSCYIRNGRIYCKSDYIKLIKCSKCYRQISASDWVRRAGELVYHLACFACDLCQRQLSTGEKFTIEKQTATESRLLCKLHFGIKNEEETSPKHELNTSDLDHSSSSNAASNISNSSPGNLKSSSSLNPVTTPTGLGGQLRGQGSIDNLSVRSSSGMSSSSKSKRVRTTFTEEQLSVLQANFQLDSNPDGQDLERIASLTGLSKRVTQVWFQNSRARQKKYMSRSQRHSGMLGPNGGSSTPPVSLLANGGRSNGVGDLWSPSSSMCSSNTGLNSDNASPMDPLSASNGTMLDSISINLPPSNGNAGAGSAGSATSAAVSSIAAAIAVSNGVNGNVNGSHSAPKWASLGVIDHSNASQYSESEHSSCSPSTAHM